MLRDYQEAMIRNARVSLATNKRILLVGPTGCGKTVLALEMIRGAVARGRRVLFLCHRRPSLSGSLAGHSGRLVSSMGWLWQERR